MWICHSEHIISTIWWVLILCLFLAPFLSFLFQPCFMTVHGGILRENTFIHICNCKIIFHLPTIISSWVVFSVHSLAIVITTTNTLCRPRHTSCFSPYPAPFTFALGQTTSCISHIYSLLAYHPLMLQTDIHLLVSLLLDCLLWFTMAHLCESPNYLYPPSSSPGLQLFNSSPTHISRFNFNFNFNCIFHLA